MKKQLDLEPQKTRSTRDILALEIAIMLVPRFPPAPSPAEGRMVTMEISRKIVDLCERRFRGLPACDVCNDAKVVCYTCGDVEKDHSPVDSHVFESVDCASCPFASLVPVASVG